MTAVRFELRGHSTAVTFRYDPMLVDMVKAAVPAPARSWNPVRREWLIDNMYVAGLGELLRRLGCTVIGLEDHRRSNAGCVDEKRWAQLLFQRVGPTRCEPVFRSLTRILHPDNPNTGDNQLQRELNAARAELNNTGRKSA